MNSDKSGRGGDRDAAVDRLLHRTLQPNAGPAPASEACLDAETLAAWTDGVLPEAGRASAESHAAGCARCQALLAAMVRTDPAAAASARWWRVRTIGWVVPMTAAAAAAILWMVVSPRSPDRQAETTRAAAPAAATPPEAGGRALDRPAPSPSQERPVRQLDQYADKKNGQKTLARAKEDTAVREAAPLRKDRSAGASAIVAPAAPPVAAADSFKALRDERTTIDIVSPDPASRWRVNVAGAGSVVQHSMDGGSTWVDQPTGEAASLTAGASPSASVCWLVGRGGVVLLSIDGRSWQRRPFPEPTDLIAVRAADAKTVTVTAADGRTFTTKDGGSTWNPAPLQESPAAPF